MHAAFIRMPALQIPTGPQFSHLKMEKIAPTLWVCEEEQNELMCVKNLN